MTCSAVECLNLQHFLIFTTFPDLFVIGLYVYIVMRFFYLKDSGKGGQRHISIPIFQNGKSDCRNLDFFNQSEHGTRSCGGGWAGDKVQNVPPHFLVEEESNAGQYIFPSRADERNKRRRIMLSCVVTLWQLGPLPIPQAVIQIGIDPSFRVNLQYAYAFTVKFQA